MFNSAKTSRIAGIKAYLRFVNLLANKKTSGGKNENIRLLKSLGA